MTTVNKLTEMRSLYNEGGLTGHELSLAIVNAILEGQILTYEECKKLLSPDLGEFMIPEIEAIEANGYVSPNPFVKNDLPEDEKRERALRLKSTYETIFAQIKSHIGQIKGDRSDRSN